VLLAALVLPPVLMLAYRVLPVPATPLMVIRLIEGEGWQRQWTPLDRISPHLPAAVIAGEDNLFCEHGGFDWPALRNEWERFRTGERSRGASTISMQTSKNLFLWPGRDLLRKGLEAWLTLQLELLLPKRRIMEIYLNIAETGPGIYGAEAAARAYFDRPAADLGRREAALIAAVLPNPRRWSPASPTGYIEGRVRTLHTRVDQIRPLLHCVE
jgi:monofunctional glycosyltransferase